MKKRRFHPNPVTLFFQDIKHLDESALNQYKFNRFWAAIFGIFMLVLPFIRPLYDGSTASFIIQEITLWSVFATHLGNMSTAVGNNSQAKIIRKINKDIEVTRQESRNIEDVLGVEPEEWKTY